MSLTVKVHPAESLLNKLSRAERKRSGDLLTRQKAEFEILKEALEEAEKRGAAAAQLSTVYSVCFYNIYEGVYQPAAIFSSRERAEAYIRTLPPQNDQSGYDVYEYTLDKEEIES